MFPAAIRLGSAGANSMPVKLRRGATQPHATPDIAELM
jgi:hypothetical protein